MLDLEFYVGPRREVGRVDERRLEQAIATLERVLLESDFVLDPEDKASVVAAVYSFIGEERSPATTARVKRLIAAMTTGRKRPTEETGGCTGVASARQNATFTPTMMTSEWAERSLIV